MVSPFSYSLEDMDRGSLLESVSDLEEVHPSAGEILVVCRKCTYRGDVNLSRSLTCGSERHNESPFGLA